ncbi:hypothetical protein ScPMuIL_008964 [Solemya velum]
MEILAFGIFLVAVQSSVTRGFLLENIFNEAGETIIDVLESMGATTTQNMLRITGLNKELTRPGTYTLFAPTNLAFDTMPFYFWMFYMSNQTQRTEVMKYHIATKSINSAEFKNDQEIPTQLGIPIRINKYANGKVTASGSPVALTDKPASNGVVHILAKAMLPPHFTLTRALEICPAFSKVRAALKFTGLSSTLNGEGPWTLFAPSDKAIAALAPGLWEKWMSDKNVITGILLNHVVKGTYYTAAFDNGSTWKTMSGRTLTITVTNGKYMVDDIEMKFIDIPMRNGVLHAMDTVIPPPARSA